MFLSELKNFTMMEKRRVLVQATELSAVIHAEMLAHTLNQYAAAMEAAVWLDIACGAKVQDSMPSILVWKSNQRSS